MNECGCNRCQNITLRHCRFEQSAPGGQAIWDTQILRCNIMCCWWAYGLIIDLLKPNKTGLRINVNTHTNTCTQNPNSLIAYGMGIYISIPLSLAHATLKQQFIHWIIETGFSGEDACKRPVRVRQTSAILQQLNIGFSRIKSDLRQYLFDNDFRAYQFYQAATALTWNVSDCLLQVPRKHIDVIKLFRSLCAWEPLMNIRNKLLVLCNEMSCVICWLSEDIKVNHTKHVSTQPMILPNRMLHFILHLKTMHGWICVC